MADLGNGSADAVDPDDRDNALRARRNDRLMRFMCLERQPLCPVRLHKHKVCKPCERFDGNLRRAELAVFRRFADADDVFLRKCGGNGALVRALKHRIARWTANVRCCRENDLSLFRKLFCELFHQRRLSAAADDGRYAAPDVQKR